MRVIDLTHYITEDMPVYPGTLPPSLNCANSHERDGFKETLISMFSHTGTHIDPPAHIFADGMTLDEFDASWFVGRGLVIDCRALGEGEAIEMELLERYSDKLDKADFLLFNLGWDKKWGMSEYFGDYPCISESVLDFIIGGSYKGIGFDVIGLDPVGTISRHKRLFSNKKIINIENLKDLDRCGSDLFTFICLPIKIKDSDGAPARAIAIIED